MPTYEYRCEGCEHEFEEFQSFNDEPLKKCPQCKKNKLRRLFGTGAAIVFKGSGFYETDYRSEAYKSAAKADQDAAKGAAPADTNGTSGKSDSNGTAAAPEAKKETKGGTKSPKSKVK